MTDEAPTPNVPLLKQTLARIEANPAEWTQDSWRCGAGMCFAGWATQIDGGIWYTDDPDSNNRWVGWTPRAAALVAEAADHPEDVQEADGRVRVIHIRERAQRILGLDKDRADELFDSGNSLGDIRRIVGELCEEAES